MHIDDWDESFLAKFSPREYFDNLKRAKIQNAMIYLQSHVGLCNFPTRTGRMHAAFRGREDAVRNLVDLCRDNGIAVTGYYSLIYNNQAYNAHPAWRMVDDNGKSALEKHEVVKADFSTGNVFRYGLCCPNNLEYREFVFQQIKEISEYFKVDGMFYDMTFWPQLCRCDSCRARWRKEVGGILPEKEDWSDPKWLLHMRKRREWMGEFAQAVTDKTREWMPDVSVEHNFACAVLADGKLGIAEPVNDACDYVGGDLYGGIYRQSFTCKFYKNITRHAPFEYMFSRCEHSLTLHTLTKSEDVMLSSVFLTTAHHGATLVIDAIDPTGTMDKRVYERLGRVFAQEMPYETYYKGDMLEDVGVYFTLRGKFNPRGEAHTNHQCAVTAVDTMIYNHIPCGVTGGYHEISKYRLLIASALTGEDEYDNERIIQYVKNGGCLYLSGVDNPALVEELLNARVTGRTKEKIVYIAPHKRAGDVFGWFNAAYPLHFDGTAPIVEGLDPDRVLASITLPYTDQESAKFVSIHSNPPAVGTGIPAMAFVQYGKGKVLWSALPIEGVAFYDYRNVFVNLIKKFFGFEPTITSDAPKDVEIVSFKTEDALLLSAVLLNEDCRARKVAAFSIGVVSGKKPEHVFLLPQKEDIPFQYRDGKVWFQCEDLKIFHMYQILW